MSRPIRAARGFGGTQRAAVTAVVKPLAADALRSAYHSVTERYSASAALRIRSSVIESGLSPDAGLDILPGGGGHPACVELRRALSEFGEPFGSEGRPVVGMFVVPHGID